MTLYLGLDLGSWAGYAALMVNERGTSMVSGRWDCHIKAGHDSPGLRFQKYEAELRGMLAIGVDRVFYENVRAHLGAQAGHVYGGFKATMMRVCDEMGIPYEALEVGEIKKHATGKGNANKAAVMNAMIRRGFSPASEDEADAQAIVLTGWETRT